MESIKQYFMFTARQAFMFKVNFLEASFIQMTLSFEKHKVFGELGTLNRNYFK